MARFPTSRARLRHRHVVLPDVHTGGAREHRDLGTVVDDDRGAVAGARHHASDEVEQTGGTVVFGADLQERDAALEEGTRRRA